MGVSVVVAVADFSELRGGMACKISTGIVASGTGFEGADAITKAALRNCFFRLRFLPIGENLARP